MKFDGSVLAILQIICTEHNEGTQKIQIGSENKQNVRLGDNYKLQITVCFMLDIQKIQEAVPYVMINSDQKVIINVEALFHYSWSTYYQPTLSG